MSRLALLSALLPLLLSAPAFADPTAYVVNEGSGTVSIIDTNTDQVRATIEVGERPGGLAVTIAGERLYVSHDDGSIVERDMYARAESGGAKVGRQPASIDLSPDGKVLAAAIQSSREILLLDVAMMRVVKKIPVSGGKHPANVVFSPDGRWLYATVDQSPDVQVIDVKRGVVTNTIGVGARLRGIAFLPDGSRAYVVADQEGEVVVIDVARHAVLARVKTASVPFAVTPHPDGKRVFVSTAAGKVQVLDTGTQRIVAEFEACKGPSSMAFTPDGQKLYVTCAQANQVAVIDAATFKRLAELSVGVRPVNVAVRDANPSVDAPDFLPRRGKSPAS